METYKLTRILSEWNQQCCFTSCFVLIRHKNSHDYPRKAKNAYTMAVRICKIELRLHYETIGPYDLKKNRSCEPRHANDSFEPVQNCRGLVAIPDL